MRIAFIVNSFPKLSETFIINQIVELMERGHDVKIYSLFKSPEIHHGLISEYNLMSRVKYIFDDSSKSKLKRILMLPFFIKRHYRKIKVRKIIHALNFRKYGKKALSLTMLYSYINILNHKKYDIIHCQFGPLGVFGMMLKQFGLLSGKLITSFRGYDITQIPQKNPNIYKKLYKYGDQFLPVSDSLKQLLIKNGCPENKIQTHYSGVYINKFNRKNSKARDNPVKIMSTARLVEKKGLKYAIKAIYNLKMQGEEVIYSIIGDGPLKGNLKRLIKDLNAESYIKLLGSKSQEEVIQHLSYVDIFLAPSIVDSNGDQEGIPNSLKEAMLMEIPVIGTNHSGIPELIKHHENGLLVSEKDEKDLANKISYLIKNPKLMSYFGINGKQKVAESFCIHKLTDQLIEIYKQD